jgi:hypothetical protein
MKKLLGISKLRIFSIWLISVIVFYSSLWFIYINKSEFILHQINLLTSLILQLGLGIVVIRGMVLNKKVYGIKPFSKRSSNTI